MPFCTNEGSGLGGSEKHLKKVCKGAKVEKDLSVTVNRAASSHDEVVAWAKKIRYGARHVTGTTYTPSSLR